MKQLTKKHLSIITENKKWLINTQKKNFFFDFKKLLRKYTGSKEEEIKESESKDNEAQQTEIQENSTSVPSGDLSSTTITSKSLSQKEKNDSIYNYIYNTDTNLGQLSNKIFSEIKLPLKNIFKYQFNAHSVVNKSFPSNFSINTFLKSENVCFNYENKSKINSDSNEEYFHNFDEMTELYFKGEKNSKIKNIKNFYNKLIDDKIDSKVDRKEISEEALNSIQKMTDEIQELKKQFNIEDDFDFSIPTFEKFMNTLLQSIYDKPEQVIDFKLKILVYFYNASNLRKNNDYFSEKKVINHHTLEILRYATENLEKVFHSIFVETYEHKNNSEEIHFPAIITNLDSFTNSEDLRELFKELKQSETYENAKNNYLLHYYEFEYNLFFSCLRNKDCVVNYNLTSLVDKNILEKLSTLYSELSDIEKEELENNVLGGKLHYDLFNSIEFIKEFTPKFKNQVSYGKLLKINNENEIKSYAPLMNYTKIINNEDDIEMMKKKLLYIENEENKKNFKKNIEKMNKLFQKNQITLVKKHRDFIELLNEYEIEDKYPLIYPFFSLLADELNNKLKLKNMSYHLSQDLSQEIRDEKSDYIVYLKQELTGFSLEFMYSFILDMQNANEMNVFRRNLILFKEIYTFITHHFETIKYFKDNYYFHYIQYKLDFKLNEVEFQIKRKKKQIENNSSETIILSSNDPEKKEKNDKEKEVPAIIESNVFSNHILNNYIENKFKPILNNTTLWNKLENSEYDYEDYFFFTYLFNYYFFNKRNLYESEKLFRKIEKIDFYHSIFDLNQRVNFFIQGARLYTIRGNIKEALKIYTYLKKTINENMEFIPKANEKILLIDSILIELCVREGNEEEEEDTLKELENKEILEELMKTYIFSILNLKKMYSENKEYEKAKLNVENKLKYFDKGIESRTLNNYLH